ncbi:cholinesterase-like isoform X2 [Andrena cerasifolii]|uniref:cholinesterase-like isoform X2 n=1 Tax=Andrena cerasifolii TaxID=2819439 RepID=UPI0040376331
MWKVFTEGGNMKYTFYWVVAALLTEVQCQKLTEVVMTDKGAVQGRTFETIRRSISYSAFLGIPYAKPPVGELRFCDPVEADSWAGVKNATQDVTMCTQFLPLGPVGQEDCLYLDVFTPVLNFKNITTPKPVMVWIYGGAFVMGSTWQALFGPDFFLEHDTVYVAMNYRLGPLGFLGLGMENARGNQGLKDQQLAMQWVQRNIAKFGGDPNRVTIFGESAGSVSVTYHLLSAKSKGLFQQAIAQSGSALCPWAYHTPEKTVELAFDLGRRMGITALTKEQLLESLKKADVKDIVPAAFSMISLELPLPVNVPFGPTIDVLPSDPSGEKAFLNDCPISKFKSGNFNHVPTMLGYNKDEGILFTIALELVRQILVDALDNILKYDITNESRNVVNLFSKLASGAISEFIRVTTIYFFSAPIDATQKYLAKYNGDTPVYYYRMSYSMDENLHKLYNREINVTAHASFYSQFTPEALEAGFRNNTYIAKKNTHF